MVRLQTAFGTACTHPDGTYLALATGVCCRDWSWPTQTLLPFSSPAPSYAPECMDGKRFWPSKCCESSSNLACTIALNEASGLHEVSSRNRQPRASSKASSMATSLVN
jgi:hypothetical protein